jgi:hypothetical protein
MPTSPEYSPSSEAISQARPMHQDGQTAVDAFDPDELLYRRYSLVHIVNGQVAPQSISFPKPSLNRSRFSRPEDVLHVDCCNGKELTGWGVLESNASDLRVSAESGDSRTFTLYPKHVPEPTCYAHSELWCSSPTSEDAKPTDSVKEKLRIKLSRVLKVTIPATV